MQENGEWRGRMEVRMDRVEEGIANFRDFQADARDFFATARAESAHQKDVDKRRSRIHYALLALLSGLIIALFSFLLTHYDTKKAAMTFFSSQAQQQDSTAGETHY